jgi:hypothetical protein
VKCDGRPLVERSYGLPDGIIDIGAYSEMKKANDGLHRIGFRISHNNYGERRYNYVGAPDNRIEGSIRTCPEAPGR